MSRGQKCYDVFISFSSKDQKVAEGVCGYLEGNGIRCFVSYRDIPKGTIWADEIFNAISRSKSMIAVFSKNFNDSEHTKREISLASEAGIPILPFRIRPDQPTGGIGFYLSNLNWIDAFPEPDKYFGKLLNDVKQIISSDEETANISMSTLEELEEDVVVFYNFVSLSLPYPEIGNIRKEMMSGLQAALIDDIGAVEHLKSVATLFDAYMKKLITYADINSFEKVKDKSQMPLLREFNYWGLSIPDFKESNIDHFKGAADASYLLGMTILTRNKVHLSPVMDDSEVTLRIKSVVSFYVYLIHRTKTALLRKNPTLNKSDFHYFGDNPDDALLYDYISYGNSSVLIKKRYVSTYAKHQLYSTGTLTEQELIEKL